MPRRSTTDRRDALLCELRVLAEGYAEDAFVQEVWRRVAEAMSGKD
jgi:hypothetical protein